MSTTFAGLIFPPITQQAELKSLLQIMCRYKLFTPDKYGDCEPLRGRFDPSRLEDMVSDIWRLRTFYWYGVKKTAGGVVHFASGQGKQTASLSVWTDAHKMSDPVDLPRLTCDIVARFGAIYGYIHYLSEREVQRASGSDSVVQQGPSSYMMTVGRWQLVRCIPDVYWANIFGREYAAFFGGRDRVAAAPAPVVKELASDTFYIQTSDNVLDVANRHAEVEAVRDRVKQHLGADNFFDTRMGFSRPYKVPQLGWQEPVRLPITPESLLALQKAVQGRLENPPPSQLKEWSTNFDLEHVEPFLRRISRHIEAGFGDSEIAQVMKLIRGMRVNDEKQIGFTIRYAGAASEFRIGVFMDDVDAPDLYFLAPSALCQQLSATMEDFVAGM